MPVIQCDIREGRTEEQKRAAPPVEHPIIRIHPETGRKAIYLGEHASHVAGLPLEEGRALVKQINAHATHQRFIYRHRWRLRELHIDGDIEHVPFELTDSVNIARVLG